MTLKRAALLVAIAPVTLPLLVLPSWLIAAGMLVSAGLFVIGVWGTWVPLVTVGAAVTLINYTAALRLAARPPDVLTATAVGITLVLVLEIIDFGRRTHGAGVDPAVIRGQVRYWTRLVLVGGVACVGLTADAIAFTLALPLVVAPAVAAAGVLVAFAGAVWALGRDDCAISTLDGRGGQAPAPRTMSRSLNP
jgi:hypothetical protein